MTGAWNARGHTANGTSPVVRKVPHLARGALKRRAAKPSSRLFASGLSDACFARSAARSRLPLAPGSRAAYFSAANRIPPVSQPSEPMFNVPFIVVATIGALILVHAARALLLSPAADVQFLLEFAFIPARYDSSLLPGGSFPGGWAGDVWTFFTYALIHADLIHLGVNIVWLLPFGTAVARRFRPVRFLAFFAATSAAGAGAHLATHSGELVPMIGASAAISGFMAASMRFAFQQGGPVSMWRENRPEAYQVPAAPLSVVLRDPRLLAFLLVWFGLNFLFGIGSVPIPGAGEGQTIAWQAHVGGFLAGLVLFSLFDPISPALDGNGGRDEEAAGR